MSIASAYSKGCRMIDVAYITSLLNILFQLSHMANALLSTINESTSCHKSIFFDIYSSIAG
jgi:hypothetical protein